MCIIDPKLCDLPTVLQDLVLLFAYNMPKQAIARSLTTLISINEMDLPFFFFRDKIWSWHFHRFLPNPVRVFMPIEYYNGLYNELFDSDAMYCLLLGLDFRRKNVRMFGSREQWLHRILNCWRVVEPFAAFYKMLMRSEGPIMKKRGPVLSSFI